MVAHFGSTTLEVMPVKLRKIPDILTGAVLSFMLALGGVGSVISGFGLPASMSALAWCCGACALGGSVCLSLRRGGIFLLCLLALTGGYLWQQGDLLVETEALLYQISRVYDSAYSCGVVQWTSGLKGVLPVTLPLCVIGGGIALLAAWTLQHRHWAVLTVIVALLPLLSCLVVTNTVPKEGYLFFLLAGLALLLLTQAVRRRDARQATALTWMLALPVSLALLVLFLAVPQSGYSSEGRAEKMQDTLLQWISRLSFIEIEQGGSLSLSFDTSTLSSMNLRNVGPKSQQTFKAMEVTAETDGTLYLRGRDYDAYDGTGWTASALRSETFTIDAASFILPSPEADSTQALSLLPMGDVTIHTYGSRSVKYLPYYPESNVNLAGGTLKNTDNETTYTFSRVVLPESWMQYAYQITSYDPERSIVSFTIVAPARSNTDLAKYTTLPTATKQWARAYLDENLPALDPEEGSFYNSSTVVKANAIADLVRQSAAYSLDTQRMPSEETDFARWFLEESDTGYCVHFATATAVLLRAAGIESRYVEGYMVSTQAGQTVVVTEADAHAWVEYYVPNFGWIPLESTAASGNSEVISAMSPAATISQEQEPDDTRLEQTEEVTTPTEQEQPHKEAPKTAKFFGCIAIVLAAIWLQWPLRLAWRRRKRRSGTANTQALVRWQDVLRLSRLLKQMPPEELKELALRAKFSQHAITAEELAAFDVFRAEAAGQLRRRPWYKQLYYCLFWAAY